MKESERDGARITIRMPPELRDAVERLSADDGRTIGGWIVRQLVAAVEAAGVKLEAQPVTHSRVTPTRKPTKKKR